MMRRIGALVLAALGAAALFSVCGEAAAKELALSFDDAPLPDSDLMTGDARAEAIISGLAEAGVPRVVFFANPGRPTPNGESRLRRYAAAGHFLANHSLTHPNLDDLTAEDYLANVAAADAQLRGLPHYRHWFRYPYLSEGATAEKRDAVRAGLRRLHLKNGYVTINTWDWRLAALLDEAAGRGDHVDMEAMRALYIETVVQAADTYDAIAVRFLHRSPRHVILLHENDLAALYIGDLVAALRADGWTIISPDRAYSDRIARREPDTFWLGQGRVAALARIAGANDDDLRAPREGYEILDGLFAARVLGRVSPP
jgi:peptidoglycan-N-acetylglucosamine deacetylase